MENKNLKILLVEDNLDDAHWIRKILIAETKQKLNLNHVPRIGEALKLLSQVSFDVILLNLYTSESQSIDSINVIKAKAPELPIIVLTTQDDRNIAIQAVRQGAQDYLVKDQLEGSVLIRSIYCAIERQRNEVNLRHQALMKRMLDKIRQSLDLQQILQTTVEQIQQFLNTERVLIYRCESGQSEEEIAEVSDRHGAESTSREFTSAINLPSLHSILVESTSVRAVEDTGDTNKNPREDIYVLAQDRLRAFLILPIWRSQAVDYVPGDFTLPIVKTTVSQNKDEGLWGMLVAYNARSPRKWQNWEINFLQRLTTQVTIAIQQSEHCCQLRVANQQLQKLAILDGLTSIANRRYFDLVLYKEWQRLTREQKPLSLILCDLDYFKTYNDTYGHQAGDRCLQKVAQILQDSTRRPADLVARYGGEEFAVILPNTDAGGALFIAQKLKTTLAQQQIPHQMSQISDYVTCSLGISTQVPNSQKSASICIEQADRALYQAKKQGRGCIVSWQDCQIPKSVIY